MLGTWDDQVADFFHVYYIEGYGGLSIGIEAHGNTHTITEVPESPVYYFEMYANFGGKRGPRSDTVDVTIDYRDHTSTATTTSTTTKLTTIRSTTTSTTSTTSTLVCLY